MSKKISIISLAVLFSVGLFFSSPVQAVDNSTGLVVSPPLKEKTMGPGESLSDTIKITNPTTMTLDITVTVEDFRAQGEEGAQSFVEPEENTEGFSLAKWIEVEKNFSLKPGESKEVKYAIKSPAAAEPGGHYGVVFFTPTPESSTVLDGSGALIVPKVGSLLLVTVSGDVSYNAKIEEFSAGKNIYTASKNTVDLITRFQNLSSVHVKPQGTIVVKNLLGSTLATLTVNEKAGNTLPDSIRKFTNSWEKKYGFGWYKADLSLTYGNGKTLTDTLTFWIIPWKETAGGLVILILIIWIAKHVSWKKK